MCEAGGQMPWLRVDHGQISDASKKGIDAVFLSLGGAVFFKSVEPMKSRSKCPRRGWGELVSEMVQFAAKAMRMAEIWQGGREEGAQSKNWLVPFAVGRASVARDFA